MTWPVVARRDLRVLRADNSLLLFAGVFALVAAAVAYAGTGGPSAPPLAASLSLLFLFAVPLTAGTVTHEAVPSAVASGRVRLTLSLPHERTTFLAGAAAARLAVTLASVVAAVLVGVAVYAARGGPLAPGKVLAALALAGLLAAAFVAATLAFTVRSTSTTLAAATTYGFFVLAFFWPVAVTLGRVVVLGRLGATVPGWLVDAVVLFSPVYAYGNALGAIGVDVVSTTTDAPAWAGVVVLAAWTTLGFALAARRFDRVEL